MRLATFNLENLDLPPKASLALEARAEVLRPALERLQADVLCLQEINGQHVQGHKDRVLAALEALLKGTRYEHFHRASTTAHSGQGVLDVHNLVTLSKFPIVLKQEVRHTLLPPVHYTHQTAEPPTDKAQPLFFDRPLLRTDHILPTGETLTVINLHLRAPLAAVVSGQKKSPFVWKSISGWAEGYFVSSLQRSGQALELRFLLDQMLKRNPHAFIALAGDFNCEDHETPLKIIVGAEEDTGNGLLSSGSFVVLDRSLPQDLRWSVLHSGRPQMVDHILASRALSAHFASLKVHNETLGDEALSFAKVDRPPGSHHAAVVAEFTLQSTK